MSVFDDMTVFVRAVEVGSFSGARRILADVAEAEDVASQLHGELKGRLKVAAPMSFGYRHLSSVVTDFLRTHPQVDIELDLNDRRVDLISVLILRCVSEPSPIPR